MTMQLHLKTQKTTQLLFLLNKTTYKPILKTPTLLGNCDYTLIL